MLDLVGGSYDLSRRANLYHLPGLSFREYLHFKNAHNENSISFDTLLHSPKNLSHLAQVKRIKGLFQDYLKTGYYPFSFAEEHTYFERLQRVVEKTIYEDIANFFQLKTENLNLFKKILSFFASIPPGEVSIHNIAQHVKTSHQTISHYLSILEQVNLVRLISPHEAGNHALRKPKKVLLNNTNLMHMLAAAGDYSVNIGSMRETFFIQALSDSRLIPHYSKIGDYTIKDIVFEIGGPNKKYKQIKNCSKNAFLVKDGLLLPEHATLPLLYFGFFY